MSRLFTFGCSFTNYAWPTWADILGLEFDYFENWGVPGIGNVGIANRIVECAVNKNINVDDTIVVQWSSHLRHDYHLFKNLPKRHTSYSWKTKGSIFNYLNRDLYDNKWIENFFDEDSFIMYTLNSIISTQLLLEQLGCKWAMTSIGDLKNLGSDFADLGTANNFGEKTKEIDLWKEKPIFLSYQDKINKVKDQWAEPIGTYCWNNQTYLYKFKDIETNEYWVDTHPSAVLYADWLCNKLKSIIGLTDKLNESQKTLLRNITEIKSQTESIEEFENILTKTQNYKHFYIGY